ncbi:peptidoglycan-associated lipoprotein Pal [Psittacicella gerlachiana]|uniref:Peptidoglycan-associated lipoprotein n=1 Tax=Psittacicella gerlachiana TaxID=2028574 RepID=A0A3A1Y8Z6_9GAMM|nr:peptidoglycan-associated lipoprotein Pal [Psittacicella gerlachiana]RIY33690.1 peptidoglycan-associated lipoprotein [Psittacicella gerlachiana]
MNKKLLTRLGIAVLASFAVAACSTSGSNVADSSFTNASLSTQDPNAKIYSGYSQNELQNQYRTVYFAFDSYQLTAEGEQLVRAHAEFIKATGAKVLLEGYTDERGTPEYNVALGAERAKAVAQALIKYGVNPANIRQISYGEERPAVLGHNEAAYAKNRRVEFNYNF